jgi:hypothetical protein
LVIPAGEEIQEGASDLLLITPTPVIFMIEGFDCREQPVESLWCLGEVINSTQASIENVQLRVTLHNAAGEELIGGDVRAALDLIPPGQRAPFGILFASPPAGIERFSAIPIRAEASNEPANRYAVLDVTQVEAHPAGSLFEVIGSVVNTGQQAVASVMVVITAYDSEGRVSGYRQSRLLDVLPADGSVEFAVSLMPYGEVPTNYAIAVQGRLVSP